MMEWLVFGLGDDIPASVTGAETLSGGWVGYTSRAVALSLNLLPLYLSPEAAEDALSGLDPYERVEALENQRNQMREGFVDRTSYEVFLKGLALERALARSGAAPEQFFAVASAIAVNAERGFAEPPPFDEALQTVVDAEILVLDELDLIANSGGADANAAAQLAATWRALAEDLPKIAKSGGIDLLPPTIVDPSRGVVLSGMDADEVTRLSRQTFPVVPSSDGVAIAAPTRQIGGLRDAGAVSGARLIYWDAEMFRLDVLDYTKPQIAAEISERLNWSPERRAAAHWEHVQRLAQFAFAARLTARNMALQTATPNSEFSQRLSQSLADAALALAQTCAAAVDAGVATPPPTDAWTAIEADLEALIGLAPHFKGSPSAMTTLRESLARARD